MFTLTKKVEFALIILKHLQEKKLLNEGKQDNIPVVKVYQIATSHKISENFVAKVMQKLCQKKILLSKQGAQGGYYLNAEIENISLLQLIESLEGHFTIVNCINQDKDCTHDKDCSIIDPMRNLNIKFRKTYENIFLSEILAPQSNPYSDETKNTDREVADNQADGPGITSVDFIKAD